MIKTSLRYFGVAVQQGSIRAASASLHVAQPAISRQLQALEQEVGVPLFERRARGIVPTPAGDLVYHFWRESTFNVERLRSEIDALQGLRRGRVRVATVESLMVALLPDAIAQFRARHPGVTFQVTMSGSDGVIEAVRAGKAEMGLGLNLGPSPEFNTVYRVRDPIMAVMSRTHSLARQRTLPLSRLAEWPMALSMPGNGARRLVDVTAAAAGISIEPVLETNSVELQQQFARNGDGIVFLARLRCLHFVQTGQLAAIRVSDRPFNSGSFDIISLPNRQLPVAAEEFYRVIRAELDKRMLRKTR